jgi:hypothetical protein
MFLGLGKIMRDSNANLIRDVFKEVGLNHTNKFLQQYISTRYGRLISISQIAAVLGRYRDREVLADKDVHETCRKFLLSCRNDTGLARKVLASYE